MSSINYFFLSLPSHNHQTLIVQLFESTHYGVFHASQYHRFCDGTPSIYNTTCFGAANSPNYASRRLHHTGQWDLKEMLSSLLPLLNDGNNLRVKSVGILLHPRVISPDYWGNKNSRIRSIGKMANAWFKAILEADKRGWIKDPVVRDAKGLPGVGLGIGGAAGGTGEEIEGQIWKKQGTVFDGFRTWNSVGTIRGPSENSSREKVLLADLNGDGIADYIVADNDGTLRAWINRGKPNEWTSIGKINPGWKSVKGNMIRLADVDNDGKADLIVLYQEGATKVWKNVDNGKKFESLDSQWATGLESRDKIYFEDMDGDGYADYVIVYEGGSVKWARNTHNNGKDSSKKNRATVATIAPGPAGIPAGSTRIRDIDGDGKAGMLWLVLDSKMYN
jgi:hypothetical protein